MKHLTLDELKKIEGRRDLFDCSFCVNGEWIEELAENVTLFTELDDYIFVSFWNSDKLDLLKDNKFIIRFSILNNFGDIKKQLIYTNCEIVDTNDTNFRYDIDRWPEIAVLFKYEDCEFKINI